MTRHSPGLHPRLERDAVRLDVEIPARGEIAALPAFISRSHSAANREITPGDRFGASGSRIAERFGPFARTRGAQGLTLKIAGGDAARRENRQRGIEAPRAAGPSRRMCEVNRTFLATSTGPERSRRSAMADEADAWQVVRAPARRRCRLCSVLNARSTAAGYFAVRQDRSQEYARMAREDPTIVSACLV
jgi:hypothetical protein